MPPPLAKGREKFLSAKIPRNPLKRLDSDERKSKEIQAFPTPKNGGFRAQTARRQENPNGANGLEGAPL
jgi:hypothetical protein